MSETTATSMARLGRAVTVAVCVAGWIAAAVYLWRTSVPSLDLGGLDPHRFFPARELERASHFERGARALWLLQTLASIGTLVVLARVLPRQVRGIGLGRLGSAIVVGMVMLTTLWLVALPFGIADLW